MLVGIRKQAIREKNSAEKPLKQRKKRERGGFGVN